MDRGGAKCRDAKKFSLNVVSCVPSTADLSYVVRCLLYIELIHETAMYPYVQTDAGGAQGAAYRLADISHVPHVQSTYPFSDPESMNIGVTPRIALKTDTATEATTSLDYVGRAVLALETQEMCHLLLKSRHFMPLCALNEAGRLKGDNRVNNANDEQVSKPGPSFSLTASTLRSIEQKVREVSSCGCGGTPCLCSKIPGMETGAKTAEQPSRCSLHVKPDYGAPCQVQIDARLFLHHAYRNTTLQVCTDHRISSVIFFVNPLESIFVTYIRRILRKSWRPLRWSMRERHRQYTAWSARTLHSSSAAKTR